MAARAIGTGAYVLGHGGGAALYPSGDTECIDYECDISYPAGFPLRAGSTPPCTVDVCGRLGYAGFGTAEGSNVFAPRTLLAQDMASLSVAFDLSMSCTSHHPHATTPRPAVGAAPGLPASYFVCTRRDIDETIHIAERQCAV